MINNHRETKSTYPFENMSIGEMVLFDATGNSKEDNRIRACLKAAVRRHLCRKNCQQKKFLVRTERENRQKKIKVTRTQ